MLDNMILILWVNLYCKHMDHLFTQQIFAWFSYCVLCSNYTGETLSVCLKPAEKETKACDNVEGEKASEGDKETFKRKQRGDSLFPREEEERTIPAPRCP